MVELYKCVHFFFAAKIYDDKINVRKNGDHDFRDSNHLVSSVAFRPPSTVQVQTRHIVF